MRNFDLDRITAKFLLMEEMDAFNYQKEDMYDDEKELEEFDMEGYLESLIPKFVQVAQDQYNSWNQDPEFDELNGGGICHLIVDKMASVIWRNQPENTEVTVGEFRDDSACHNSLLVAHAPSRQLYQVDIPYYNYETGGGYDWQKISNVKFDDSMVHIRDWSGEYEEWLDDDGEWHEI